MIARLHGNCILILLTELISQFMFGLLLFYSECSPSHFDPLRILICIAIMKNASDIHFRLVKTGIPLTFHIELPLRVLYNLDSLYDSILLPIIWVIYWCIWMLPYRLLHVHNFQPFQDTSLLPLSCGAISAKNMNGLQKALWVTIEPILIPYTISR